MGFWLMLLGGLWGDFLSSFTGIAGNRPAASHFSLLRQRKVTKRKATLFVVPALRCGHAAVLGKSGVNRKLASLKQALALIHFALRSSPQPGRVGDWGLDAGSGSALTPALSQRERE